jgi:hypothetical protein
MVVRQPQNISFNMSKSTREEKQLVMRKLIKYLNSNDQALADEVFSEDFKMVIPGTGGTPPGASVFPPGREGKN